MKKILDDRQKLKHYLKKNLQQILEKQWLRQKLLEYKVKKGDLNELMFRMDIIPVSIALAQAAKEVVGVLLGLHSKVTQFLVNGHGTDKV